MAGIIAVRKEKGISSAQVVSKVKRILINSGIISSKEKVGHLGTLDPLASGVLPIAVGRATRLFDYHLKEKKEYVATFEFGYSTDTLDLGGKIVNSGGIVPNKNEICNYAAANIGKFEQIPPNYSAKSINGVRAYVYARKGQIVEMNPKTIEIFEFDLLEIIDNKFLFKINCSSGTYIRSIVRDMASALSTYGVMTDLVRTKSGPYFIENSFSLEEISQQPSSTITPLNDLLFNLESIHLTDNEYKNLRNGIKMTIGNMGFNNFSTILLRYKNDIVAIAAINDCYISNLIWLI